MRWSQTDAKATRQLEREFAFFFRPVQDDDRDAAVTIQERSDLKVVARTGAEDSLGAGTDEPAEMSQIEVGTLEEKLVVYRVRNDGSAAEIVGVVRAAGFIKQHVPIYPAYGPSVQVINDLVGIPLPQMPRTNMRPSFLAAFGKNEHLVWPC